MLTHFGTIPGIGKLDMEQIFWIQSEPTLFTALDENDKRYLCICCQLGKKYLVAPVTNKTLVSMITDRVTIRDVFRKNNAVGFTWDGEHVTVWPEIPSDMYPRRGKSLEMRNCIDVIVFKNKLVNEARRSGEDIRPDDSRYSIAMFYGRLNREQQPDLCFITMDAMKEHRLETVKPDIADKLGITLDDPDLEYGQTYIPVPQSIVDRIKAEVKF